ncbi:hypothetical protein LV164_008342 [Aspergillus fumigatus]|nr:hypothetical protein KXX57_004414 [Aspergillus fumigatus]KAH1978486.1 hypothetical protein KXW88_007763 [Aspergillus fumigatus]KAH2666422.1 hypothetical protein KXV32_006609 [Aspergillus fumigatus]KAH3018269.1 hypothetical protein KXW60_006673 [Aspergillus fumigatus]KAH3146271.1 hypothetical protein KXW18_006947 [Aspergillus fumigatus]
MPDYRKGEKVRYKPVGGPESKTSEAVGIIREVATEPTQMTGRNVAASDEEPRYTVSYYFIQCVAGGANWGGKIENARTHKQSAIKESNILGPEE